MRQIVEAFGIKPQFETDTIPQNIVSGCSIRGMAYKTNAMLCTVQLCIVYNNCYHE